MTGHILWLASYPKSGNTWMRILLNNYMWDSIEKPADINDLSNFPIASSRILFDRTMGVAASEFTHQEVEPYKRKLYEHISAQLDSIRFFKVHDAYTHSTDGLPIFSSQASAGVVYLIRNPLDVCVSLGYHDGRPPMKVAKSMGKQSNKMSGSSNKLHDQLVQRLLTWSNHVKSWVDQPELPTMVVRYEDLHSDTEKVLTDVLLFCQIEIDPSRVTRAVELSTFKKLQSLEAEDGFTEKPPNMRRFFRRGIVSSWRDELEPEVAKVITTCHAEIMQRFGYDTKLDSN